MRARVMVVAAGLLAAACIDDRTPTGPGPGQPLASLSDGNHGSGNLHFFFLPPIVQRDGPFSGVFDNTLDPVVDICKLDATGACVRSVAHFASSDRRGHDESDRLRVAGNHYAVNWHTRDYDLDVSKTYRICVSVGPGALGHADVDLLGRGEKRKNVDRNEFVPVQNGSTLPIKFRIEKGAVAPGAFVDDGCIGAMLPAEIHGRKCLVTGEHDEDDDRDGHDEDDDHEDGGHSWSATHSNDAHDDHGDGHDDHEHDAHDDHDEHEGHGERPHCDDESAGIGNWPISLTGTDDQGHAVTLTTATNAGGQYSLTGLRPGTYTVCEPDAFVQVFPNGFVEVFPSAGADCGNGRFGYSLVLGSGQVAKHKDFGNAPLAGIHGTKVVENADGSPSSDASGWHINLLDGNGNLLATATTGVDGKYAFMKLAGGTYTVCEVMQAGFTQSLPSSGPSCDGGLGYSVVLSAGENAMGNDFGNRASGGATGTGEIHGKKFEDANANSEDDDGLVIQDWPIMLTGTDEDGMTVSLSTTTDAQGRYAFTVNPGTYTVCEGFLSIFFVQRFPLVGEICPDFSVGYLIKLGPGEAVTGKDFGNQFFLP